MNKGRSARRARKSAPSVSLLTLPHSGKLPPQDSSVYPPISGAHAQSHLLHSCARPPRPARPQIGPAGGLSSAIFAKGTNGPDCLHGQGGGPASLLPSLSGFRNPVPSPRAAASFGESSRHLPAGEALNLPTQDEQRCAWTPRLSIQSRQPARFPQTTFKARFQQLSGDPDYSQVGVLAFSSPCPCSP